MVQAPHQLIQHVINRVVVACKEQHCQQWPIHRLCLKVTEELIDVVMSGCPAHRNVCTFDKPATTSTIADPPAMIILAALSALVNLWSTRPLNT